MVLLDNVYITSKYECMSNHYYECKLHTPNMLLERHSLGIRHTDSCLSNDNEEMASPKGNAFLCESKLLLNANIDC